MAPKILYFGEDTCHRIPVFEYAGYAVVRCRSLFQLRSLLESHRPHAIVVNDEGPHSMECIRSARACSGAPLILFRNANRSCCDSDFDWVVPSLTSPTEWLHAIAGMIGCGRDHSENLHGAATGDASFAPF